MPAGQTVRTIVRGNKAGGGGKTRAPRVGRTSAQGQADVTAYLGNVRSSPDSGLSLVYKSTPLAPRGVALRAARIGGGEAFALVRDVINAQP